MTTNRKPAIPKPAVPEKKNPEASSSKTAKMKRPRKPGKTARKPGQGADHSTGLGKDGAPNDPQRRKVLERNRIAATRCRIRKRDEALRLASCEQAMEDQNRQLSACFDSLRAEIYTLKTQLLQHADCGCLLIQEYIANEAKKSVDILLSGRLLQPPPPPSSVAPSCTSTSTEPIQTQSPITAVRGEDLQQPWVDGFARSNAITAQDMDSDQHKQATALSYHLPTGPLTEPFLPPPDGIRGFQYSQDFMNEMIWDPEWQIIHTQANLFTAVDLQGTTYRR